MRKIAYALAACGALATLSGAAHAADAADAAAPAAPTGPGLMDVLTASGLVVHGYVDAAYSYDSVYPSLREFDLQRNGFNVHQVGLQVAYQPMEGFGGVVTLTGGQDAYTMQSYGEGATNFDITQAFVQYASGNWTVIGGKFLTLVGAEVANASANTNYSRSLLFTLSEPISHTGVRATYAVDTTLSFNFGVNNGWDQFVDKNTQKTIEWGATYAPVKAFSLGLQGYVGSEPTVGSNNGLRNLIDLVATYNVNDSLTLILNYDYGSQKNAPSTLGSNLITANWQGVAGYLNYAISDQWRVSVRAEYFDDKDGYRTGVEQKVKEGTLTFGYDPTKAFELRAEVRVDDSDQSYFVKPGSASPTKNQTTLALEGVVKF